MGFVTPAKADDMPVGYIWFELQVPAGNALYSISPAHPAHQAMHS